MPPAPAPRHTERHTGETPHGPRRWWVYQAERFPLAAHAPLIACFSFCAASYSSHLRGAGFPDLAAVLVSFPCCLIGFLHLRLADEFKDIDEDRRWRPYRAVPRGLVTLRELGWLWVGTAAVQVALATALDVRLTAILLATWVYLALMTREFFARTWLKARPVAYLLSHMVILPLIDFLATACDWIPAQGRPPPGLGWFLAVSFANGVTLELGRKIRAAEDEEAGVETYSGLWGRPRAAWIWCGAVALTFVLALAAAAQAGVLLAGAAAFTLFPILAAAQARTFSADPRPRTARRFELLSAAWTLALYAGLGTLPALAP